MNENNIEGIKLSFEYKLNNSIPDLVLYGTNKLILKQTNFKITKYNKEKDQSDKIKKKLKNKKKLKKNVEAKIYKIEKDIRRKLKVPTSKEINWKLITDQDIRKAYVSVRFSGDVSKLVQIVNGVNFSFISSFK